MEFIIADSNLKDLGYLDSKTKLDLDVGKDNDFEITIQLPKYDSELHVEGNYIYCLGTEYGGRLDDPEVDTKNDSISFTGDTFRGMLDKKYIEPPTGEAYRIVSGELNECIAALIDGQFGAVFVVSENDTGVIIESYKVPRYCSLLSGITKMLKTEGYRLNIKVIQLADTFGVELSAVPIVDYSEEIETSQDSGVEFNIKRYTNFYNYILCLGSGELADRTVYKLHLKDDGSVEQVDEIPKGMDVRVYLYDYPNAESDEELLEAAIDKFSDINKSDSQSMTVPQNIDAEIGDIVGGRDYFTGITIKQTITKKIIKIQNEAVTVSYTIGDD